MHSDFHTLSSVFFAKVWRCCPFFGTRLAVGSVLSLTACPEVDICIFNYFVIKGVLETPVAVWRLPSLYMASARSCPFFWTSKILSSTFWKKFKILKALKFQAFQAVTLLPLRYPPRKLCILESAEGQGTDSRHEKSSNGHSKSRQRATYSTPQEVL